jgi:hypothetical protein
MIERNQSQESESLITLPEGVFKSESIHEKVTVKAISSDVRPPLAAGQEVVVLSKMVEEVEFDNKTIYLVLENYVLGIVEDNTR